MTKKEQQTMPYSKLQYISQGDTLEEQKRHIQTVLDAGADWIQIRWKQAKGNEFLAFGEWVKARCESYQAICIVNDHVDTAKRIDADGVHLGLTDMSVSDARSILGNGKIIGGTANTAADMVQRVHEGCNYIGLGPFRYTKTKQKLSPILGLEGFGEIIAYLKQLQIPIPPIYAIGGIQTADISPLQRLGIYGVAVSGLLTADPQHVQAIKSTLL